jgi:hypothetical protein
MKRCLCILLALASLVSAQAPAPAPHANLEPIGSGESQTHEDLRQEIRGMVKNLALNIADSAPGYGASLALTVYIVSGSAELKTPGGDDIPADLAQVLKQMQGVFAYKSYKLIEAITLQSRNNSGAEVAGSLPGYLNYDFKYARARISGDKPRTVKLDGLRLEITRHHYNRSDIIALVSTDLDTHDGQKTVVGKSAVNGTDALFLVIVPKVSE